MCALKLNCASLVAMSALEGSVHDPNLPWVTDRSIFVGNSTTIQCGEEDPYSSPAKVLWYGALFGTLLSFLIWLLTGLSEQVSGMKPMEINHVGTFVLIPPFYLALGAIIGWRVVDCTLGCSAWAASAPSISFFTANIQREGYMMLFMTLTLTALIFFKRIDQLAKSRGVDNGEVHSNLGNYMLCGEWLARAGFTLTTITGIMPSLASNCHIQPAELYERCWEEEMSNPHGAGVAVGIFLSFCGLQLRAVGGIKSEMAAGGVSGFGYIGWALVCVDVTFVLMLSYFGAWLHFLYAGGPNPFAIDVCILHETREACIGEDLPPLQQEWSDQRPGGWRCRWDPNVDYYLYPCTKHDCNADGHLDNNKYSVIFEYLGFLHWAVGCAGMMEAIKALDNHAKSRTQAETTGFHGLPSDILL